MTVEQETTYAILVWVVPILLAILAFVGALAVNQFIAMNKNLNSLNTKFAVMLEKHDSLEKRVDKIETLIEV